MKIASKKVTLLDGIDIAICWKELIMNEMTEIIIAITIVPIVGALFNVIFERIFDRRNEKPTTQGEKRRPSELTPHDEEKDKTPKKVTQDKKKYWLIVVAAIIAVVCLSFVVNNIGETETDTEGASDQTITKPDEGEQMETDTDETEGKRRIEEMSVKKEAPEVYQGSFVEETETGEYGWEFTEISTDTYTVNIDVKGVYGVTASDLHNDSKMYFEVFDGTDSKVDMGQGNQTISNKYGFSFSADEVGKSDVRVGETCKINLKGSAETPYKLYIWKPKDIVDLTYLNTRDYRIHDSMQFPNQENGYSLDLDSDNVVSFKLDNLSENSFLELKVYARNGADDRFWEEIDSQLFDAGSEDRMAVELKGKVDYIVYVKNNMDTGVSPYTLSVIK